jgi:hypothetical protein
MENNSSSTPSDLSSDITAQVRATRSSTIQARQASFTMTVPAIKGGDGFKDSTNLGIGAYLGKGNIYIGDVWQTQEPTACGVGVSLVAGRGNSHIHDYVLYAFIKNINYTGVDFLSFDGVNLAFNNTLKITISLDTSDNDPSQCKKWKFVVDDGISSKELSRETENTAAEMIENFTVACSFLHPSNKTSCAALPASDQTSINDIELVQFNNQKGGKNNWKFDVENRACQLTIEKDKRYDDLDKNISIVWNSKD